MTTKTVIVSPWDANWPRDFEKIRMELEAALGVLVLDIEHVGSTSVEGLAAKPIIDIDVVIRNDCDFLTVVQALHSIGYIHEGNLGIPGREAFRYDCKPHLKKHHLYVCTEDSPELKRHRVFRDYLRQHPDAAAEYAAVKEEAARLYPNSIDDYIACKSPCIEKLYALCGLNK